MNEIEELKKEIELIKERNKRVELDKDWEISLFRKISIILITYILATAVMYVIGVEKPYINSLIPTLGFFLSVQSLPFLKKIWIKKHE